MSWPRTAWLGIWLILVASRGMADGLEPVALAPATYAIEIQKGKRLLLLKQGDRVARRFQIAIGRGGLGDKRIRGDNKTPVGVYHITGFNETSPFHLFMRLNYPNVKDGFFGLKQHLISRQQFDRIVDATRMSTLPPQDTLLGGAIGIHGLGVESDETRHIHAQLDWTQGCIALTNREIEELRRYVDVGTRVVIRE